VNQPGTLTWFARHECRLAWRDWLAMMTAGRRRRLSTVFAALIVFAAGIHGLAYAVVGRFAERGIHPDKAALVIITSSLLLFWSLLMSQAMESVTRAFYARSDLDLILTSPAAARRVFAVRIATMALSIVAMALLLASPFINMLTALGGTRWLGTYAVVAALGFTAAACAVALTVAMFRTIGPRRTRFVAQVVAAVIGAAFVIGLQVAGILSYGTLSRVEILQSDALEALAPDIGSIVYWPARAVLGEYAALVAVLVVGLALFAGAVLVFSSRFGDHAIAAAGVSHGGERRRATSARFRTSTPAWALRHKEWRLLVRDPWLMSQTLMQILYLAPPALLLWRSFGEGDAVLVLVPVLVMAAGQLAGGLAWLATSGEDAPDLVATAPVSARSLLAAKVEAVMGAIAIVFAPFVTGLAFFSAYHAAVAMIGISVAAASASQVQLWFRHQAKRSHFRRRQISSRMATFAEAFSSIMWAAAAALAAAGTWLAVIPAVIALGILAGARWLSPRQSV